MENIVAKFSVCEDETALRNMLNNYFDYFVDLPEGFSIKPYKGKNKFWLAVLHDSEMTHAQARDYFTSYAIEKGYVCYALQHISGWGSSRECAEFPIGLSVTQHEADQKVEGVKAILGYYHRKLMVKHRKVEKGFEIFIRTRRECDPETLAVELIRYLLSAECLRSQSNNLYTVKDAAQKLGVTTRRINEMIRSGQIKAEKFGTGKTVPWMISGKELHRIEISSRQPRSMRKLACYLKDKGFYYNKQKGKRRGWWHADSFFGHTVLEVVKKLDSGKWK